MKVWSCAGGAVVAVGWDVGTLKLQAGRGRDGAPGWHGVKMQEPLSITAFITAPGAKTPPAPERDGA